MVAGVVLHFWNGISGLSGLVIVLEGVHR
jgi:hypothetical protein